MGADGCMWVVKEWVMCSVIVSPCNSIYRVESANYANSYWGGYSSPWWDYFNTYGRVPMELSANQSYLLRGVLKEAYGLDYLRVSMCLVARFLTKASTSCSDLHTTFFL